MYSAFPGNCSVSDLITQMRQKLISCPNVESINVSIRTLIPFIRA